MYIFIYIYIYIYRERERERERETERERKGWRERERERKRERDRERERDADTIVHLVHGGGWANLKSQMRRDYLQETVYGGGCAWLASDGLLKRIPPRLRVLRFRGGAASSSEGS